MHAWSLGRNPDRCARLFFPIPFVTGKASSVPDSCSSACAGLAPRVGERDEGDDADGSTGRANGIPCSPSLFTPLAFLGWCTFGRLRLMQPRHGMSLLVGVAGVCATSTGYVYEYTRRQYPWWRLGFRFRIGIVPRRGEKKKPKKEWPKKEQRSHRTRQGERARESEGD